MNGIFAARALLPSGWAENVRLQVETGVIKSILIQSVGNPGDTRVDTLLPAIPNLHSHTFQRAMAGMTEHRGNSEDSFWTWRDLMYRFVAHLTPEDVEAIAAMAFVEMLEQGFASVAEFHYLHHQPDGQPFAQLSEMSQRMISAATTTGIGLTHLPVLYSYGGLAGQPLQGGQLRFGNTLDRFSRLCDDVDQDINSNAPKDFSRGVAPHSLRAVSADQLRSLTQTTGHRPIHMHIAEQVREVADVKAALGNAPVAWLLDNVPVNRNWCLIHATHMTSAETVNLARSGAVAGLCPITESNLGDGIFNGVEYLKSKGVFGTGSDSNVRISAALELQTLEYSQRLRDQRRNALSFDQPSTGQGLYVAACQGGSQALGRKSGAIAEGQLADLMALDSTLPSLCALKPEQLIDGWVFASTEKTVTDVWSAGRHCVSNGRHHRREAIALQFRKTMAGLQARL